MRFTENFTKIFEKEIKLHKCILDKDIRLIYGMYKTLFIIDINDIPENILGNQYLSMQNIPKTVYTDPHLGFYYAYSDQLIYPYLNYLSIDEMKNEKLQIVLRNNYFLDDDYNRSTLIAKLEKQDGEYYICYYIKRSIIETIQQKRNKKHNLLIYILATQKKNDIIKYNNQEFFEIMNPNFTKDKTMIHISKKSVLKDTIKLYNYQLLDVNWMESIEKKVDNGENEIEYVYSPVYNCLEDEYIMYNDNLFSKNFVNEKFECSRSFKYFGGNIISEVGLGKTITALYYILSSQKSDNRFIEFTNNCNYFYKRGKSKSKTCLKSSLDGELFCREHLNCLFIDKRDIVMKNMQDFKICDFVVNSKFKTNATLIVCPNHLCDQWVREYYDKFENNHRVVLLVTFDQYSNIKLVDLLFADIVVVSYNFLMNKKYLDFVEKYKHFIEGKLCKLDFDLDNVDLLESSKYNILELFNWNRVVFDEAHEIQNMSRSYKLINMLDNLKSKYRWNITGTPFPNKLDSFISLMSYNTSYVKRGLCEVRNMNVTELISLGFNSDIILKCKELFRRNTKESIKDEYAGNILRDHIKKLIFTNQERVIYDSYLEGHDKYSDFLIKICCHSELHNDTKELIKNCKTLDEIQRVMLDYNKRKMDIEKTKIEKAETDLRYYKTLIPDEEFKHDLENANDDDIYIKIGIAKRQITIAKKNLDEISRTYNYLKQSIELLVLEENTITCPICLDDIDDDNIAITKCGHKFCWDCIYQTHKIRETSAHIKCPTCNSLMTNKELYLVDKNKQTKIELNDLDKLVHNIKSTKIGNIIYFLKNNLEEGDKVILFSQWDEMLHKVGKILTEQKMNPIYCNGTVYQRKHAINSFCKNKDVKLIMLSSRNAASGINLTIANKIILLEPIYGTKEFRYNIESQAVARADRIGQTRPIDIYRFIIKDTIEEDIINDCIDDSKIKQMSIN
jgi:SNF2 family DNA or RNA helicase